MTDRERVLAAAAALVVGLGVGWTAVLEPALARMAELSDTEAVLVDAAARDRDAVGRLPALREERAALRRTLAPDPDVGSVPLVLGHLRAVCEAAGVSPTGLRYARAYPVAAAAGRARAAVTAAAAPFAEVRFELETRATLPRLQDLLVRLARGAVPVRVVGLAVTTREGAELEVSLSLASLAPASVLEAGGVR